MDALDRLKATFNSEISKSSIDAGLSYSPRPDDVILMTAPKSGTTWMSQILHSLTTRGDMSFTDINLVVINIEAAQDYRFDLSAPTLHPPRVLWSHLWYPDVPKGTGTKYIYVTRDPMDAGPSLYHHLAGWFFNAEEISMDQFLSEHFVKIGDPSPEVGMWYNTSMWHHLAAIFPHRADPNLLWLHFEDLIEDRAACIKLIAEFIRVGHDDPELQALVVEQSDINFMKQFPSKWGDEYLKETRNVAMGLEPDAGMDLEKAKTKVREGKVGKNKESMSSSMRDAFEKKWLDVMAPATGFATYHEMRDSINRELRRPFKSCS